MNEYYDELDMTEKEIIKKYPFARKYNYSGNPLNSSWYGDILKGWRKAFGKKLLEEIAEEYFTLDNELKSKWNIVEAREKYGGLRIDTVYDMPKKLYDITDSYEDISIHTCQECGRPCRQRTVEDWIYTLCDEFWNLSFEKNIGRRLK